MRNETISLVPICKGSQLLCTLQGNILFGCPPEVLKFILLKKLPMPEAVVLPSQLYHQSCSQVALEFPFYHFLFVQRGPDRGHKFRVFAKINQCKRISEMLRVTIYGPTKDEMINSGTIPQIATQLDKEFKHLAVKNPNANKPYQLQDIVKFHPLQNNEKQLLYPEKNSSPAIYIQQIANSLYSVSYGEQTLTIDISTTGEQIPPYPLTHKPLDKSSDTNEIIVLGGSNGFDPNNPANGYIFYLKGKLMLWDSPSYLSCHLKKLQITLDDIDALVLSHVHEDHLDVVECVNHNKPLNLYTTKEIYYCLLVKLMAVYDCSLAEAQAMHSFHPITPDLSPHLICGTQCFFFHSIHPIPTLGLRMKINNDKETLLYLTGDHVSYEILEKMNAADVLPPERYQMFKQFPNGQEQLVIADVGGGLIHGDFHDYLKLKTKVAFMHTHFISDPLPEGKFLVHSGQHIPLD